MSKKRKVTGGSNDRVTGTWETIGNSWVSNGATVETDGLLTKAVVTSGNTTYKTYFTLIQGSFDNPQKSAASVAYADSNKNGSLDLKEDLMLGTAVTKSLADNPGGFSGTFSGSLKSKTVYSLIDGKRVGETTYDKSLWGANASKSSTIGKPPKDTTAGQGGNGKQNGATKDPITGQLLTFSDLGTIESDRVYGKDNYRWLQPIAHNLGFTKPEMDALKSYETEFEFNSQYIIVTTQVKGDKRQEYGISEKFGSDWTSRWLIEGDFSYTNGKLSQGVLKKGVFQLVSQSNSYEGGNATSYVSSAVIQDSNSFSGVKAAANFYKYGESIGLAGLKSNFYPSSNSDQQSDAILKNYIQDFGDGRFFYSGWETNPFNSNLI